MSAPGTQEGGYAAAQSTSGGTTASRRSQPSASAKRSSVATLRLARRGDWEIQVTALRFPGSAAVGTIWWPGASGDRAAIGTVDLPDGAAVRLKVGHASYGTMKPYRPSKK